MSQEHAEDTFEIINRLGLHARAASRLVQLAGSFPCHVTVRREEQVANAKSVMGVLLLCGAKGTKITIEATGAALLYLPPYSPDLNPIEQAFAKIKHWMRDAQKRTLEDTWRQVGSLVQTISADECHNYLVNAGYASSKP